MEEKVKKIDAFKLVSGISLAGIFVTVGLAVLMATQVLPSNTTMFQILIYVGILCLGSQLCLNWIKYLTIGKYKLLSILFISFVAFCSVMWIVGVAIIFANLDELSVGALKFLKVDVIVTLQFIVANFVATCLLRYKKTNIVFQAIAYLSYLFLDFWLTSFALCLAIDSGNGLSINTDFLKFLFTKPMYSLLALSVVYVLIVNAFTRRAGVRRKRVLDNLSVADEFEEVEKGKESVEFVKPAQEKVDVKKKLEDLKAMLDQNLITQEEYDKKKAQLLDQM